MTDDEKLARAARARQILDDPMVKEALADLERTFTIAWLNSKYDDHEGRERCYRQIRTARAFSKFFEDAMADGDVAAHRAQQYRAHGEI